MFKRILLIDWETRWSKKSVEWAPDGYTLSGMTTEEYIRSPLFKAFGVGVKYYGEDGAPIYLPHESIRQFFAGVDWETTAICAHNCVTGDHEVRTRAGWVRLDALEPGVEVLQWDPATRRATYTVPVIVKKHYSGNMYEWDTQYHKGIYTAEHRMYYNTPGNETWRVAEAQAVADMGQNNVYLPASYFYEPEAVLHISESEARGLEMIRADGYVTTQGTANFRFKKQFKIDRCQELLTELRISFHKHIDPDGATRINTHAGETIRKLTALLGQGKDKKLGEWILQLSPQAREAYLEELQFWDGSVATSGGDCQTVVCSAKREDVYWLVELALASGYNASANYDLPNNRGFSRADGVIHKAKLRKRNKVKLVSKPTVSYYNSDVYCLNVSTSAFVVRRNGVTWATGNCQFDAAILTWIYGIKPAFIFDTLSMARALYGIEVGNSAAKLADRFGLPPKGTATHSTDGLYELPLHVQVELAEYCKHDVFLCEKFLDNMLPGYPVKELKLIDMTIRMFTEPQLALDSELLQEAIDEDANARSALLGRLGLHDEQLASNDQFAEALRALGVDPPTKISPTTGKEAYAFAKNDALFLALLNGDSEEVVLLCEARMKVKSTQTRTRAQRFLDIAGRGDGLLPVPVNYAHTRTLRWGAAKGSNINMQNLKRGGVLRRSIVAQPGHMCVAGDLSQIEPRVLAYLSDYTDLLNIFASGKDAYAQFGAVMFGIPGMTKESHGDLRQSAKSALLGCFAADTQVLTKRGWVPIVQVRLTDQLWDGEEWVNHSGLLNQGMKTTFLHRGVRATADHEILTAHGWQEWNEVRTNPSLFQSALSLASLPVSHGKESRSPKRIEKSIHTSRECGARAVGKGLLSVPIFAQGGLPAVTHALKEKLHVLYDSAKGSKRTAPMWLTANGSLRACLQSSVDVLTKKIQLIRTMAVEVSRFILSGLKTALSFSRTSSLSTAGTTPNYSLTASTTTEGTNRATCGSVRAASTWLTSARLRPVTLKNSSAALKNLSERTQTYDIALAGPRNRYTILTDDGPIIVHNCGYGLGWASFASQLLVGFLGAPPVRYDRAFMKQLGIGKTEVLYFLNGYPQEKNFGPQAGAERLARMMEIPRTCSDDELLVHCVCAKEIIDRYRAAAKPVTEFWDFLKKMLEEVISVPGVAPVTHKCITYSPGKITLPNGLHITYDGIKRTLDARGRPKYTYWNGKTDKNLYHGILAENVVSGTARCVIGDGMLRVQKKYKIGLTVHDELVTTVPAEEVESAKKWIKEQMIMPCTYLPGIPLNAEVGAAWRYGEAK